MVTSATKLILSEFQLSVSVRKPWRLWWHRDGNDYSVMMWPHCLTMFLYSAILRWPMSTLTTSKSFYLNRVTTLFVIGYVMGIPISCSLSLLSGFINKPVALHSFKINDVVYSLNLISKPPRRVTRPSWTPPSTSPTGPWLPSALASAGSRTSAVSLEEMCSGWLISGNSGNSGKTSGHFNWWSP